MAETLNLPNASNETHIQLDLAALFQENTVAKVLAAAEAYLEDNVSYTESHCIHPL